MDNNQGGNLVYRLGDKNIISYNKPQIITPNQVARGNEGLYSRRDAIKTIALALSLGAVGKYAGGCAVAPPQLEISQKEWDAKNIWEKAGLSISEYGAIDDYVKAAFEKKDLGVLVQGIVFYPGDWLLDIGRTIWAGVYDIPKEAMRRAKEEKAVLAELAANTPAIASEIPTNTWVQATELAHSNYNSNKIGVLWVPIEAVLNAGGALAEGVVDSARFLKHYALVAGGGTIKHVGKYPLEFIAHFATTWLMTDFIYKNTSGRGGAPGEALPPQPPFPEPLPPPPPF